MQNSPGSHDRHVHFGEVEDILSTSFYNEGLNDTHGPENEEEKKKKDINARVVKALETDDVSMLKQLLVEIPELETYIERPLAHLAAQYGALKILQECVSKPADSINAASADFDATTPLYWAIKEGHAAVADWLLGAGAFHQPLNVYQDTAVYVAVYHSQVELLNVLWAHNCDCNTPNRNGDIPLMHVIRTGNIQALDMLIKMGVDVYGGNRENITTEDEAENAVLKHIPLDLTCFKNIGPLCEAVISGKRRIVKAIFRYIMSLEFSLRDNWQWQKDMKSALAVAVISRNLDLVQMLLEADVFQIGRCLFSSSQKLELDVLVEADVIGILATAAMRQAEAGEISILRYLVQYKKYHVQLLMECIHNCREKSSRFEGYPYCKWDLLFVPSKGIWTVHYIHRDIVRYMAEAGLNFKKVSLSKPSPFMEAVSTGLLCFVYDMLRYGAGLAVTRKRDKDIFINVFYTALLPKNRLSGFRRKFIRAAFILASYPLYYNVDTALERTVKKCLENSHEQADVLQGCVIRLAEMFLYRIHNASTLSHLCRTVILTHLNHAKTSNATSHLNLPTRLVEYLNLKDLLEQDRMVCLQMGRVPEQSNSTDSEFKRCPCFPAEHMEVFRLSV